VCLPKPGVVHWGLDGWTDVADTETRDTGLGLHAADLDLRGLAPGRHVDFTWRGREPGNWVGRDFRIEVVAR
jgi:glucoamylase